MTIIKSAALFIITVSLSCSLARADTVAISVPDQAPNITDGQARNVGWEFTTNTAIKVTSLGAYDPSAYSSPIEVGILTTSGSLLASATVPANSSSAGQFQYVGLSTPLMLASGQSFIIDAFVGTEHWLAPQSTGVSVNPAISVSSTGAVWFTCCEDVGFKFPGGATGASGAGNLASDPRLFFGPNFQFAVAGAVPELSSWAMMLLGFVGLGFLAHRRKNGALRFA